MEIVIKYFKSIFYNILGWFELIFRKESNHKFKIDHIDLINEQERYITVIYYKTIGCRSLQRETAINLNKSTVFSLFRPDHAQMIVSIATVESLLNKDIHEIIDRYQKYISYCQLKLK